MLQVKLYTIYYLLTEGEVITRNLKPGALMYWPTTQSIHQGLGLRFPCNDQTDEVFYGLFIKTWANNQLKPTTGRRITLRKHVSPINSTLYLYYAMEYKNM